MNIKNKPPMLMPREYRAGAEKLSKAALMDLAWYMADCIALQRNEEQYEVFARMRNHVVEQRKDE